MTRTFKEYDTVYHERRYWKQDNLLPHEVPGWNAKYIPYEIVRLTPKRLMAVHWTDERRLSYDVEIYLNRQTMEREGKQYHSRFHEYFYAEIPAKKQPKVHAPTFNAPSEAASFLKLTAPYSAEDVKRAYKRLARQHHPDAGGDAEAFIRLQKARDVALQGAWQPSTLRSVSGRWHCSCGATMSLSMSGHFDGFGAQMVDSFVAQHRGAGHRLTQTA